MTDAAVTGRPGCPPEGGVRRGRLRAAFATAAFATALAVTASPSRAAAFDFDDVTDKAKALAQQPFQDPTGAVPRWLVDLSYDQWRDIRFRPDRALWKDRGVPFEVLCGCPGEHSVPLWEGSQGALQRACEAQLPPIAYNDGSSCVGYSAELGATRGRCNSNKCNRRVAAGQPIFFHGAKYEEAVRCVRDM